jgi:hypothetical protein
MRAGVSAAFVVAAVAAVAACAPQGELSIEVDGGNDTRDGISANRFADGWAVRFERVLLVLFDVAAARTGGDPALEVRGPIVVNAVSNAPIEIASPALVEAAAYDSFGLAVAPLDGNASTANANDDDVKLMTDNRWSVFVAGQAFQNARSVRFQWGFDADTRYPSCETLNGDGITVSEGGSATWKVRVDVEQLFRDDLTVDTSDTRFAALAAADGNGDGEDTDEDAGNDDGVIEQNELDAFLLSSLPQDLLSRYNTGGAADIASLNDYVRAATRSMIGFQLDGRCEAERR